MSIRTQPYLLLLPSVIILFAFTLWPMGEAVFRSLYVTDSNAHLQFAGFANYASLAADPVFWTVLTNTLWFLLGTVPVSILLAMWLAVLLNRKYALTPWFRLAFFHPVVLPMVSAASIWLFMYTPGYGIVDQVLSVFGMQQTNWLGQPQTALLAVMVMTVWKQVGYFMVFYLAGLQNVAGDALEAAAVDGAGALRTFRAVTFPLLMPTTMFVLMIAVVNGFQMVDQLYVMTQGGPNNATNMLLYYIYQEAFSFLDQGKASALSVILIAILVTVAIVQNMLDKRVHYQ